MKHNFRLRLIAVVAILTLFAFMMNAPPGPQAASARTKAAINSTKGICNQNCASCHQAQANPPNVIAFAKYQENEKGITGNTLSPPLVRAMKIAYGTGAGYATDNNQYRFEFSFRNPGRTGALFSDREPVLI